jgi:DNA primase
LAYVDLNDAVISQVRHAADIVDFISQITPLKPAGKNYKGLCPFHREKTPSFQVDRDKGLFYCFGCQTGGDIFKFLQLTERFTFPEAVEHVAARVGIILPKRKSGRDGDKDDLLGILDEAASAYRQALEWRPNAAERYLTGRSLDEEIWKKYGFGYAPESWDYLLSRLGGRYTPEVLEKAGLVLPRKSGTGFYDRFRNRLMIPIRSDAGHLIGFGGRSLDGSDPKYLNSPESAVFNKSSLLYNIDRARDAMRRSERAILVEGYFDAIAVDDTGVGGVVASMGTSLTAGQASILRRYAKRVVIAYDGDSAGRSAALRAASVLLSTGLNVAIADVGPGEDPDTLIRKRGVEGFMEVLANASDVFRFALTEWAPSPASMSPQEKSGAVESFVGLLTSVSDPVVRNEAAQLVADALRLEFETVWSRVRPRSGGPVERALSSPVATGEKMILRAMLQGELPGPLQERVREEFFEDASSRNVYLAVNDRISSGQSLDFPEIATHLRGDADLNRLSELVLGDGDGVDPRSLEETIRLMERRLADRTLAELQAQINQAVRDGDAARLRELDLRKIELSRQRHR